MSQPYQSYREKVIFAGGIYHVTQRAPGREMLFLEEDDYLTMLYLIKKYTRQFDIDVFSFCLMSNHIHLQLHINKPNLSEAMQALFTAYAVRFNKKYERKGHVFCGVYRAALCKDDLHIIGASLYIHLNPLKAGMVKHANEYQWSSVGLYTNHALESFVHNSFILAMIDDNLHVASQIYEHMLTDYNAVEYRQIHEDPQAVISFAKAIRRQVPQFLPGRNINDAFIVSEQTIDDLIDVFKQKKRILSPTDKQAVTYLIEQLIARGFTVTDIATMLNMSRPSVYKQLKVKSEKVNIDKETLNIEQ